jgi:hypothetical protein
VWCELPGVIRERWKPGLAFDRCLYRCDQTSWSPAGQRKTPPTQSHATESSQNSYCHVRNPHSPTQLHLSGCFQQRIYSTRAHQPRHRPTSRSRCMLPISLRTRIRLAYTPLLRNTSSRTMSNVAAFVAAAERADSSLVGTSDKDKAAIAKLAGEAEKLSKDLPVSRVWMSDRLERVQAGLIAQHSSTSQF